MQMRCTFTLSQNGLVMTVLERTKVGRKESLLFDREIVKI